MKRLENTLFQVSGAHKSDELLFSFSFAALGSLILDALEALYVLYAPFILDGPHAPYVISTLDVPDDTWPRPLVSPFSPDVSDLCFLHCLDTLSPPCCP